MLRINKAVLLMKTFIWRILDYAYSQDSYNSNQLRRFPEAPIQKSSFKEHLEISVLIKMVDISKL